MKLNFPESWERKQLNDLIEFVTGGDWGKDPSHEDEAFELAYCIRGSEIRNWETEKGRTASLRKVKRSSVSTRSLQEGDILVEISGGGPEQPVGRTVMIDKEVLFFEPDVPKICTNFLRLVRPTKEILSSFLNLFLKLVYSSGEVVKFQGGSNNLRNLKFGDYVKIEIPLPPLAEQKRIVVEIEALFSELDAGKAALQKAAQQLKTYRQAVLKFAFEGRLTNDVVVDGELPDGWNWVKLGNLFSDSPQNGVYKPSSQYGTGTQIIRIDGFYDGRILDDYEYKRVKLSSSEIQNYSVSVGDILINRVNSMPYLGKCGLVRKKKEDLVFESNIMKVKVKEETVLPEYITMYLSSKKGLSELRSNAKQAVNQASINQTDVANVSVPFPPLDEQQRIVQEIEARLSVCDKMEETIAESLQQAEALRQSILKKAFEGKLI